MIVAAAHFAAGYRQQNTNFPDDASSASPNNTRGRTGSDGPWTCVLTPPYRGPSTDVVREQADAKVQADQIDARESHRHIHGGHFVNVSWPVV